MPDAPARPVIAVVGGGFGGLACVRALRGADARVLLIDRRNHHLFQPLLYQVATAALSPANIAAPIRRILRSQANCTVLMGEATSVNPDDRTVTVADEAIGYDYLVLACGMKTTYFGNDRWARIAPGLKSVDDALDVRRRILLAFESAEREDDPDARRAMLTFVIIGAGPTGVEMAGAIAEIAAKSIPRDFRRIDPDHVRVILAEGLDRVLPAYPPDLSRRAQRDLEQLGVEVLLGDLASAVDEHGVTIGKGDDARRIESRCVIWAAGLEAEPVGRTLDADTDKSGRVKVNRDLSVPDRPNIFVIGDQMLYEDPDSGEEVPGVAQGAMQSGRFVGELIAAEIAGRTRSDRPTFRYRDKGQMATIGRARAVADIRGRHFGGFAAWALWSLVHIAFLIGFRRKLFTMLEWGWLYLFWSRGASLITGERARRDDPDA